MGQIIMNIIEGHWVDQMVSKQSVIIISVMDVGEMGLNKGLSDFDKGHIVMAR